jgi:uncharacterized protein (UPF0332 family)
MPKLKTLEETYDRCLADGQLTEISEVDTEYARSLSANAEVSLDSAKALAKLLSSSDKRWQTIYLLHYDAIHLFAEALLALHKVNSRNHQCLFAALCLRNTEFDWNFFEKVRTLRNGINYYAKQIGHLEWKEVELGFTLTISLLKKEIEKILSI